MINILIFVDWFFLAIRKSTIILPINIVLSFTRFNSQNTLANILRALDMVLHAIDYNLFECTNQPLID